MSYVGYVFRPKKDEKCEEHPEVLAVRDVVTEADSMGFETTLMCQECYDDFNLAIKAAAEEARECDHCHSITITHRTKDPEEGFSGRFYNLCQACRKRMMYNFL